MCLFLELPEPQGILPPVFPPEALTFSPATKGCKVLSCIWAWAQGWQESPLGGTDWF